MSGKYATLKDVAELAGTTPSTVSYVLNEKAGRYISEDMRARVLKAVEETGYVKSSAASSLRGKKRGIIAILIPQFSNRFFTRIILEIEAEVEKEGYVLSICNTFDVPEREHDIINRMVQLRVDGYIMIPTTSGRENTKRIRHLGVPMVVVDRPLEGTGNYDFVTTDNYLCGKMATEYLIKKGHRQLAFIGWPSGIDNLQRRCEAFRDAAENAGIPEENLVIAEGEFSEEAGYALTKQVLENHPETTALFYAYNIQAKGGTRYFKEHGLIPGKDISVILIGSPEWAMVGQNDYAHIDQRERELGRHAARLLLQGINETKQSPTREICLEPILYEGSSVADFNK